MARHRLRGWTLVELLVGMSILGMLAGYGVPAMREWLRRSEIRSSGVQFMQMLDGGRYLALAENDFVTLCPLDEITQQCGASWGRTVQMFVDIDASGTQDASDRLLHGNIRFPDGTWLVWRAFRNRPYIQWAPFGKTNSLNGTFTLCNREREAAWIRQWVVNKAGRVREVNPARVGGTTLQNALQVCG
jgi:type IV fimbrial biogenesis protein FimT